MNKVFKTILIINICLGITIPANAAVSVSDGSAFVTKAEFSADLNNLSNRMASLENSIDSKIDSLVSSYLTRNGIWNGKKQSLESYRSLSNSLNTTRFKAIYESGTYANVNSVVDGLADNSYYLVRKLDKSGLVNVVAHTEGNGLFICTSLYRIYADRLNEGYWLSGGYFNNHKYIRDGVRYGGNISINYYINGINRFTNSLMTCRGGFDEDLQIVNTNDYGAHIIFTWVPQSFNAYFFANKDDVLTWNIYYNAVYGEYWTNTANHSIRGSNFSVYIDDVIVY